MRRYQISSAGFLLLLGTLFCFEASKLTIGKIVQPGPGFFPFWLGLAMIILSLALIGKGSREKIEAASVSQGLWKGRRWQKVIFSLGALLLYAFFLESLGYILSTFLLMFFLFRTIEAQRWPVVILGSVITSFFTYILFRLWLQVQLPMGLWGI